MTAVARVGDPFACSDHVKEGSPNVFINNLPVARLGDPTTGHGCWSPNAVSTPCSPNVFANHIPIASLNFTQDSIHCCSSCHQTKVSAASPDVFVNGK